MICIIYMHSVWHIAYMHVFSACIHVCSVLSVHTCTVSAWHVCFLTISHILAIPRLDPQLLCVHLESGICSLAPLIPPVLSPSSALLCFTLLPLLALALVIIC